MSGNSAYIKHRCQGANVRGSVCEQIKNYKDHKVCHKAEHNIAAINLYLQSLLFFFLLTYIPLLILLFRKKRQYCASTQKTEPTQTTPLLCGVDESGTM